MALLKNADFNIYNNVIRTFLSELVGTTIFVFLTSLSYSPYDHGPALFPILSGLSLLVAQLCYYHISGAYYNPVITISRFVHGNLPGYSVVCYVAAQILGGFFGAVLFRSIVSYFVFKDSFLPNAIMTYNHIEKVSRLQAFILEAICTSILCTVRHNLDQEKASSKIETQWVIPIVWTSVTAICQPLIGQANNIALVFGQTIVFHVFTEQDQYTNFLYLNILSGLVAILIFSIIQRTQKEYDVSEVTLPATRNQLEAD